MTAAHDEVQHRRYESLMYRLIRSRRRTIEVHVTDEAEIVVRAPRRTAMKDIHAFLAEKKDWIEHHRRRILALAGGFLAQGYKDGARFLFMGEWRTLRIRPEPVKRHAVSVEGDALIVRMPFDDTASDETRIRGLIEQWFRKQASEFLGVRVFHWSRRMGVEPDSVSIKEQKHLWGSCAVHRRAVHLNWRLIMAPPAVTDAVIVHELCHLWVPDHSKRFWRLVFLYFPHYKQGDQWLRRHRSLLRLPRSPVVSRSLSSPDPRGPGSR